VFIYVITNTVTGKIYIGQHKGNSLKKYLQTKLSDASKHRGGQSRLYNSMRKHPKEVWSIEPLFSNIQTKEELDRLERLLIALYDTRNPEIGYNICKGGEGFTGTHTDEWKQMMRERMTGRVVSPETCAKLKALPKNEAQLKSLELCQLPENIAKRAETIRATPRSEKQQEAWQKALANHHSGLPEGYTHSKETRKKFSTSLMGRAALNRVDMIGQVINGVTVLERAESSKSGKARWRCRCHCGSFFIAAGDNLRSGNTKGCGCSMPLVFQKEVI
jgi:hypothetical protein